MGPAVWSRGKEKNKLTDQCNDTVCDKGKSLDDHISRSLLLNMTVTHQYCVLPEILPYVQCLSGTPDFQLMWLFLPLEPVP